MRAPVALALALALAGCSTPSDGAGDDGDGSCIGFETDPCAYEVKVVQASATPLPGPVAGDPTCARLVRDGDRLSFRPGALPLEQEAHQLVVEGLEFPEQDFWLPGPDGTFVTTHGEGTCELLAERAWAIRCDVVGDVGGAPLDAWITVRDLPVTCG